MIAPNWQTNQCKDFANEKLAKLPLVMRGRFARAHAEHYNNNYVQANLSLVRLEKLISEHEYDQLPLSDYFDENKLTELAEEKAALCKQIALPGTFDVSERFEFVKAFIENLKIEIDPKLLKDKAGLVLRSFDVNFWRRNLRKVTGRAAEHIALTAGLVHSKADIYCSDFAVARYRAMKKRNQVLLENTLLTNEDGQTYTLKELSDLSVSNPKIRRAELMTRIRGFEDYAKHRRKAAVFITITAPSKYHTRSYKYNGATPRDTQNYINKVWSRIRAQLARERIDIFGFRVAEPHHDGTPHGHSLLFCNPDHQARLVQVFNQYALEEDGEEKGARKNRVKVEFIDSRKGSAASYIAKYISKNIDGYGVESDLYGEDAAQSAERIVAWASLWGIRQFQQIGGIPVTIWRTLRKVDYSFKESDNAKAALNYADSGDWGLFMRYGTKLSLLKESDWEQINHDTGAIIEAHKEKQNQFGDYTPPKIIGVQCDETGEVVCLNFREWDAHEMRAWTRVNNCTVEPEHLKKIKIEPPKKRIQSSEELKKFKEWSVKESEKLNQEGLKELIAIQNNFK